MTKKVLIITFVILFIGVPFLQTLATEKRITSQKNETIILNVAGDKNFPPYEYIDENWNYTGFNVDIMRAIALQAGVEIHFYPMDWYEACEKLKNGEIDVVQGMKYTKERDQYYDFSAEYLENSQSIFITVDNDKIDSFERLEGTTVAVQQGDVVIPKLHQLKDIIIYFSNDQEHAMQMLINKQVDAYVGNTLAGVFMMNKKDVHHKIKIVGETLNPTKYSAAVKDGDIETLRLLNKNLEQIKKNGTYDKIYRKWFGQPTQLPSWYIRRYLMIIGVLTLVVVIVLFLFYRWNHTLKREVHRQTQHIKDANDNLMMKNIQIQEERDFRGKILNEIFSGIITVNQKGIVTFANKPASEIFQIENSNLLGKHYTDTPVAHILTVPLAVENSHEQELNINKQNLILNYKVSILSSLDKELEEIIVIFRDVTEERWMQENIKTKDKLQSLGNLIAGIAHEIRNPLTSIKTYAELIPKKFDNPKFRAMVSQDIPAEIDRLNTLISDLLEYSRPKKPFKEKVNLMNAINSVELLLHNKIQKEKVYIHKDISPGIYIHIDKNHLRQVLINILLNAIESIDNEDKRILLVVKETPRQILLSISDNGCGIDEESFNHIYNPFYTTKPTGTGLGLFVCYQLLTENEAEIKLHSMRNQGTTVTIQFKKLEDDQVGTITNCG